MYMKNMSNAPGLNFVLSWEETATETYGMIEQLFDEQSMSRPMWFANFKTGRTSINDDKRIGRPRRLPCPERSQHFNGLFMKIVVRILDANEPNFGGSQECAVSPFVLHENINV